MNSHLTRSLREPGGPCTKSMEVSESRMERVKRTLYSEKNMNSLNVEYFLAMNMQNLDTNG